MRLVTVSVTLILAIVSAQGQPAVAVHGVTVGLSLAAVNDLIRNTAWGQRYGDDRNQPLVSDPIVPMLTAEDYDVDAYPAEQHPFHKWVCLGGADCLYWDGVDLRFRDDTVAGVWVSSQPVELYNLTDMIDYADRLANDVQRQLGSKRPEVRLPTPKIRRAVSSISRDHESTTIAEWRWRRGGGTHHVLAGVSIEVRRLPHRMLQLDLILRDHTIAPGRF